MVSGLRGERQTDGEIRWVWVECLCWFLGLWFWAEWIGASLLSGEASFQHDSRRFWYPIFHFFAEQILRGELPLWDPYNRGGEPFFPGAVHFRLLEPILLIYLYLAKNFTQDIHRLFNGYALLILSLNQIGIYLWLRKSASGVFRLSLIPMLIFSTMVFLPMIQDGLINGFLWVPYMVMLLERFFFTQQVRLHHWVLMGFLLGCSCQSYRVALPLIMWLFFALGMLYFERQRLLKFLKLKSNLKGMLVCGLIVAGMMAPNLALLKSGKQFDFPLRSAKGDAISMDYEFIRQSGSAANAWTYLKLPVREWDFRLLGKWRDFKLADAYEGAIFLGAVPWFLALIGFFYGVHPIKKVWGFVLVAFILLSLGPSGALHPLLYYSFPPAHYVRHTSHVSGFVQMFWLFFYVLGAQSMWDHLKWRWQYA